MQEKTAAARSSELCDKTRSAAVECTDSIATSSTYKDMHITSILCSSSKHSLQPL